MVLYRYEISEKKGLGFIHLNKRNIDLKEIHLFTSLKDFITDWLWDLVEIVVSEVSLFT